ncbi:3-oxoacyl-(acyl-carrier-protein) synthase [Agrobacterium vitis]|nr:3-oxoacyl-(acyl-carrier-protein) synthase [Agrobacterium vitis]MBE1436642.1 3-oxoacyl-(acyl-carrier-protein) synthase [Agrobacterium vitis]
MVSTGQQPIGVVVTGIGVISALGNGRAAFEDALFSGVSGIGRVERFDTSTLNCHFGAEAAGFDGANLVRKAEAHLYDRVSLLAMAAADEAIQQAGLNPETIGPTCGVMMGTAFGPAEAIQESVLRYSDNVRLRPTTVVKMMFSGPTAALCVRFGLEGASSAHVTACAASGHAIAEAVRAVQSGVVEVCLAGGAEAFPSSSLFAAWDAFGIMSPDSDAEYGIMRPFAADRSGFVIGEAAAVLVLEREDRARARGATILAEVLGSGVVSDAPSLTKPTLRGMVGAMRAALADSGVTPEEVGHVNAHATATDLNDALEADAIMEVFGARAQNIPVSACKAAFGHCMGAASAIEAAATVLSLQRQQAPFVANIRNGEGTLRTAPAMATDVALSNSFAFGGHYVSLAFRRAQDGFGIVS